MILTAREQAEIDFHKRNGFNPGNCPQKAKELIEAVIAKFRGLPGLEDYKREIKLRALSCTQT